MESRSPGSPDAGDRRGGGMRTLVRWSLGPMTFGVVAAAMAAYMGAIWLLSGWLRARFGLGSEGADWVAILCCAGAVWVASSVAERGRPAADPDRRQLDAKKRRAFRRKTRFWWMIYLVGVLVMSLMDMTNAGTTGVAGSVDRRLMNPGFLVIVCWMMADLLGGPVALLGPDEALAFERQEAIRWGYGVLAMLGVANLAAAGLWPAAAARAWAPIVVLGVLVPQVRLAMLTRAPAGGGW